MVSPARLLLACLRAVFSIHSSQKTVRCVSSDELSIRPDLVTDSDSDCTFGRQSSIARNVSWPLSRIVYGRILVTAVASLSLAWSATLT